jgi:microsomal dipeptidase-like Zn-dependent dipeptidase
VIGAVARRGGMVGLIMAQHFITDGMPKAKTYDESFRALCRHIDRIHEITGSYDAIGIGSDLDGYIKPALPGLGHEGCMLRLQHSLRDKYGPETAEMISSGNALRVLRAAWTVRQQSA